MEEDFTGSQGPQRTEMSEKYNGERFEVVTVLLLKIEFLSKVHGMLTDKQSETFLLDCMTLKIKAL
jgi:hypothetical protein